MKKLFKWFKEQIIWITSKRVSEAINNGATYDEVCEIVKEEMEK